MRKLTWAALAYTVTVFLMHYLQLRHVIFIALPLCFAFGVIAWFCFRGNLRRSSLIVALFVLLGIVRYETHYNATVAKFDEYIGQECRITAEVCEYPVIYEDSVKYTVILDTDLLPKVKANLYDYTSSDTYLRPGARIRVTVKFASALMSSGEDTDTYVSKGVYVRGYTTDEIKVLSNGDGIRYWPLELGEQIRDRITLYMSEQASAFLSALITGDKTALYEDAQLNHTLTRAGLAHVVAVSGMHVSFIVSLSMMLLGMRKGWALSVLLMALFAVMTGLSPSVIRAVFMQTLFLLAPVLRREPDGITSISFALLIILLINPFAVAAVGLQLSFLAMAGIILVTPRAVQWFERKCPFTDSRLLWGYRFISASLSSSLGATLFTAPVCAYYFGSVSVLAPVTNLLVLWIVPICFAGGFLLCLISVFIPTAAPIFARLLNVCVSFLVFIAERIGAFSMAVVYLPEKLMLLWFLIVYTVILIMLLFRKNGMYRPLFPMIIATLGLMLLSSWTVRTGNKGMLISAIDVGQGQCIAVFDDDRTLMVDCGGDYDCGETAAQWLYTHGRKQVDILVLSHFDEDHINGVLDLMLHIPVKEIIYCGNNLSEDELPMYQEIREMAERNNTKLHLVNTREELSLDSLNVRLEAIDGDSSNDGLITYLQSGGYRVLIMGDGDLAAERQLMRNMWLNEIDCLVVGHHGSAYSTGEEFLERIRPRVAIISSGVNAYGHPSEEVLDRLTKKNVIIYRTDQMGTIEIKVR